MKTMAGLVVLALLGANVALAQDGDKDKPVTREEFEKQKKELEALKAKLEGNQGKKKDDQDKKKEDQDLQAQIDELEKQLKAVKERTEEEKPGWTKMALTGFGFAGFEALRGEKSSFTAGFNPVFLWKPTDRLFFEAQIELTLEGNDTGVALEYAQLCYILNDFMTIGAGRFLTPFGTFQQWLHQAWINKLPDNPFAYDDGGITPEGTVGVELRGAFALGDNSRLNYAVYVGNSPRLDTDTQEAGILFDDNFTDTKDPKVVGARVGFLPIPELEVGYSVLTGHVGDAGTPFSGLKTVMHGPDLMYLRDSELLYGTVTVFGQWTWSSVTRATYTVNGVDFNFPNHREGGYIQGSYRPSKAESPILKSFEVVVRYDVLHRPNGAPDPVDDHRTTIGLDYWITPSAVVKLAYQWDKRMQPGGGLINANGVVMQWAMGF
jgi:hypothetical protein